MSDEEIPGWKSAAKTEIGSIKGHFAQKHGWKISIREEPDYIYLFVEFRHARKPDNRKVFRLAYSPSFPTERPRENFVNPENFDQEGPQFWIDDGQSAFKSQHNPPVICLEGTWGFHHNLHRDRPPERAVLTKLLLEIQACYDKTP